MAQTRRARRSRVFPRFRPGRAAPEAGLAQRAGHAPGPDEPRRRDLLGSRRRPAFGDPRTGQQRRRRAHGGAGLDCGHADAASPAAVASGLRGAAQRGSSAHQRLPMRMRLPLADSRAQRDDPRGANTMMVEPCSNQPISSPLRSPASQGMTVRPAIAQMQPHVEEIAAGCSRPGWRRPAPA